MTSLRKIDFNPNTRTTDPVVLSKEADTMNTLPQTTINPLNASNTTHDGNVVSFPAPAQHSMTCEESRFSPNFLDPDFPVVTVKYANVKRVFDIVVSSLILILASPFMLLSALLVRLTSKGPVLFRQVRVGRGGRLFYCLKFRSMYQDAEARRQELMHLNEMNGPVFKIKNDPRITPIGRIIRKLSIDELPQLFNVIKGDMSLVGPRPPLPCEVEQYTPYQRQRLSVVPGITCIWQISGRNNITFERWVELDLLYIETMSFGTDLKILLQTLPAVMRADGAQ